MKRFVFFGHHKAGSSWLNAMFWNLFADKGIRYKVFQSLDESGKKWLADIKDKRVVGVGVSNAMASDVASFKEFDKLIHVVRDPRDMAISAYYSHRDSHPLFPGLAEERERLLQVDYTEGLKVVIDGLMSKTFGEMLQWPLHVTENLKFEDIKANFAKIAGVINGNSAEEDESFGTESLLATFINQALVRTGFGNPCARERDFFLSKSGIIFHSARYKRQREKNKQSASVTGKTPHYRSGKSDQWRSEMPREIQEYFHTKYPGLVEKYQYEIM